MSIYHALIAWAIILGVIGLLWVAAVEIGKWRDRRWKAERPARPVANPEWIAGIYDHAPTETPTFDALAAERHMGPIFEAGYERQAKRLRDELEDDALVMSWLYGGGK